MEKRKVWYTWLVVFSILAMLISVLSCSTVQRDPGSVLPTKPAESTPATTNNGGLPAIQTYQDLDVLKNDNPASIDNSKFPITPVEALHVTANPPQVDMTKYTLSVDGLVNNPLAFGYDALLKYPSVSEVVLLICPGAFVDNAEWTGVPLSTLLKEANLKPEVTQVAFHAMDGYKDIIALEDAQKDGVLLAYKVNGQILPQDHGYPVRLVVKGLYGSFWVKWVDRITIEK
jgi:DMSO/TMAO reductase YedYZ molybdopterin-dependent catalytic subunit